MIVLTESQKGLLSLALEIAAKHFAQDAEEVATVAGHERMADLFRQQKIDAESLSMVLAESDEVRVS